VEKRWRNFLRICIDIDGVLCQLRKSDESYGDLLPIEGAAESLVLLRSQGHYIILFTARHMKSMNSNLGLVVATQGQVTLDWLRIHGFVYDEIYFGKPYADLYIDDLALRFTSWENILRKLQN